MPVKWLHAGKRTWTNDHCRKAEKGIIICLVCGEMCRMVITHRSRVTRTNGSAVQEASDVASSEASFWSFNNLTEQRTSLTCLAVFPLATAFFLLFLFTHYFTPPGLPILRCRKLPGIMSETGTGVQRSVQLLPVALRHKNLRSYARTQQVLPGKKIPPSPHCRNESAHISRSARL